MEMVLTLACLSLVGVVVSTLLLSSAMRTEDSRETAPKPAREADRPRFFEADGQRLITGVPTAIPVQVLLLQIEQHVRMEQAAAESFHLCPTPETLHKHTTSPLVH